MDFYKKDVSDKRLLNDLQQRIANLTQDLAFTRMELKVYRKHVNKLTNWVRLLGFTVACLVTIIIGLNV